MTPTRHAIGAELLFCQTTGSKVVRKCRVQGFTFGPAPKYDIALASNPLEVISGISPDQLYSPKIKEVSHAG